MRKAALAALAVVVFLLTPTLFKPFPRSQTSEQVVLITVSSSTWLAGNWYFWPVIVTGQQLADAGVNLAEIDSDAMWLEARVWVRSGLRWRAEWIEVPLQFDERGAAGRYVAYEDGVFDENDEIVFFANLTRSGPIGQWYQQAFRLHLPSSGEPVEHPSNIVVTANDQYITVETSNYAAVLATGGVLAEWHAKLSNGGSENIVGDWDPSKRTRNAFHNLRTWIGVTWAAYSDPKPFGDAYEVVKGTGAPIRAIVYTTSYNACVYTYNGVNYTYIKILHTMWWFFDKNAMIAERVAAVAGINFTGRSANLQWPVNSLNTGYTWTVAAGSVTNTIVLNAGDKTWTGTDWPQMPQEWWAAYVPGSELSVATVFRGYNIAGEAPRYGYYAYPGRVQIETNFCWPYDRSATYTFREGDIFRTWIVSKLFGAQSDTWFGYRFYLMIYNLPTVTLQLL